MVPVRDGCLPSLPRRRPHLRQYHIRRGACNQVEQHIMDAIRLVHCRFHPYRMGTQLSLPLATVIAVFSKLNHDHRTMISPGMVHAGSLQVSTQSRRLDSCRQATASCPTRTVAHAIKMLVISLLYSYKYS